jgi:hypothetical protein
MSDRSAVPLITRQLIPGVVVGVLLGASLTLSKAFLALIAVVVIGTIIVALAPLLGIQIRNRRQALLEAAFVFLGMLAGVVGFALYRFPK